MSDFQKNGNPESSRWKTSQDEFRGYMRAKMEEMHSEMQDVWKSDRAVRKRVRDLEKKAQVAVGIVMAVNAVIAVVVITKQLGFW